MRAADVAAAAGMSTTAVSFVINGRDAGSIFAVTRARVLKAAEELGYRPNHIVRSLRQRSTSSIGLVTDASEEYLTKPFTKDSLLKCVQSHSRRADQELAAAGMPN